MGWTDGQISGWSYTHETALKYEFMQILFGYVTTMLLTLWPVDRQVFEMNAKFNL